MARKKRQHFVPQYYLRWFTEDERGKLIHVLRKSSGDVVLGAGIRNQCAADYFYGDAKEEDWISELENEHRDAVSEIRRDQSLGRYGATVREALLFQYLRTRHHRMKEETAMEHFREVLRESAPEELRKDPAELERILKRDMTVDSRGMQRKVLARSRLDEVLFSDLQPLLLVNQTDDNFVCSDAPVVLYNQSIGVPGLQSPGLEMFFPLGRRTLLMLFDAHEYSIDGASEGILVVDDEADVAALNRLQFQAAHQCVFFGERDDAEYVRKLWEDEGGKLVVPTRTVVAPQWANPSPKPGGETRVQVSEPRLPEGLELGFLSFDPAPSLEEGETRVRNSELVIARRKLGEVR